ncbi:WAT1-related protein isoform X1 [Tanacetum coccineum]
MEGICGMVGTQVAQVLLMVYSKAAIADGMSSYSFIFYSNALASLILLPLSFIIHRSPNPPPLNFGVICGFFIMGLLGFLAQIFGFTGVSLSSATLGTTLLNLIPGCTFVLAIICRHLSLRKYRSGDCNVSNCYNLHHSISLASFLREATLSGDGFYLGSLLGSVVVVAGFYTVMWGKAKEQKVNVVNSSVSSNLDDKVAPLLQDVEEQNNRIA